MNMTLLNYTTRTQVEQICNRKFTEVTDTEFNIYLGATETFINNYLGYNATTTLLGLLTENVSLETSMGKTDAFGNLVIDLMKPPIHVDVNGNPLVTAVQYHVGTVKVTLQLTDGSANAKNSFIETSENRRKIYYPSTYFIPAISTVTPTQKMNLFNLKDVRFWVDISYTGGYDTVPYDITLAADYICSEMLLYRDNPNFMQQFTQGSLSQTFFSKSNSTSLNKMGHGMQLANTLLQPYVRYTF